MKKILHSADWHLRDKDIEEAEKCLNFLVETARIEDVDLVIIAGDIFDSQDIKLDSLSAKLAVKTVSGLADIAPAAIVIGTPSHDGKAAEVLKYTRGKFDVFVASHPQQVYLEDGFLFDRPAGDREPECVLSLIPTPTKQHFQGSDQDISQAMSGIFAGFGAQATQYACPHIPVYHGSITGAVLSSGQTMVGKDIEISSDQLSLSGAHLVLCGHIHLPQELPGNIFYSGSIYACNWGENHKHGFYLHEFDGNNLIGSTFVETPCKKMVRLRDDFTVMSNDERGGRSYRQLVGGDVSGAHVRYDVTVWQDEAGTIDKDNSEKYLLEAGALSVDIRIIRIPRENVRAEAVLKAETLRDKITKMAELRGEEVNGNTFNKADMLEGMNADQIMERIAI